MARAAAPAARSSPSCREALTAGTMRDGVRVGDLEPPFLQVVAIIEERTADEERAFRIDHDADVGRLHHDVAIRRAIHEIHLVLQTRAAAANHGDAESTGRAS